MRLRLSSGVNVENECSGLLRLNCSVYNDINNSTNNRIILKLEKKDAQILLRQLLSKLHTCMHTQPEYISVDLIIHAQCYDLEFSENNTNA